MAFIQAQYADGSTSLGSGAVVSRKGAIVTNYHVVQGAADIKVTLPRPDSLAPAPAARPYTARIVKTDACHDLALLQIPQRTPAYLVFADDAAIAVGEPVRAVGNPKGQTLSVSSGVISGVRPLRELGVEQAMEALSMECQHMSRRALGGFTFIQTDAAITLDNDGGPLLNAANQMVGLNALLITESAGLNFAIHAKHLRQFVATYAGD